MISDNESDGPLWQQYDTDVEVCRTFLHAAYEPNRLWTQESIRILSRPDIDWSHLTVYLTECGLARPLLGALKGPAPPSWLPDGFVERLQTRATQDVVDDLLKREALARVAGVLREVGGRGILLKGTALQVLRDPHGRSPLQRATGDIDIYVAPPLGSILRLRLLENGFGGTADDARTAPHHLAPVLFRGVSIEIHEHLMPTFWGLPEREMLEHARPVDGLAPLSTLNPAGFLLHAGMHASAHLFADGLKTAWDLLWICRRFPELDWEQLFRWVEACRLPRGFWVPVRVLSRKLSIPIPAEFLRHAPVDLRQLKLETFTCDRLFSAVEGPFDLNPFSKNWIFMLLHESWIERFRYLAALSGGTAAQARRSAKRHHRSHGRLYMWKQLREAFSQWRQYQRIFARKARTSL